MHTKERYSILVVDDTQENIDIIINILDKDFEISVASDGKSALGHIDLHPPDLILMDIMMPVMDGIEACRHLKASSQTKEIPVIFLTAKTDLDSIIKGFQVGAVDYISKPFNPTELLVRVNTHLQLSNAKKELDILNTELRFLAEHDDLTGLYNTRYLYKTLQRNLIRSRENDTPLSLLFIDIDDFKTVVDTHGHLNGSMAIREVAQTIATSLSQPCYGIAYGGDEFVVVLPYHSKSMAIKMAKIITKCIADTVFLKNEECNIKLSTSCGIATFPDDAGDEKNLLSMADKALFKVKETGKGDIGYA